MIEDAKGLTHASEILTVEGLDVIFIGRLDLSISMGIPGQIDNPAILEAIKKLIPQARAAGKAVGVGAIDAGRPERVREFIAQGAQFFALNTAGILTSASKALLKNIRG
jgi:2-keto-3-deoxy-L-rhamnonate aldolase RhmA